jgi:hypothetical protein
VKDLGMKQIGIGLVALGALAGVATTIVPASGEAEGEAAPIFGVELPPGYRDWRLISVAHEEGTLNDLRAILGNDIAIKADREGRLSYPDGAIIARLAWSYDPLEESSEAFGQPQSYVAGPPKNGVQFMVKDSKNTPRPAAGASLISTTVSPPMRRCTTPALPATRSPDQATLSSTVTHLRGPHAIIPWGEVRK